MPLRPEEIIELLRLEPLPEEGGFFRETYRAAETIPADALPARYRDRARGRAHSTQIYFLITPRSPSLMHLVASDEVFHHYAGDPVEQLHLTLAGQAGIHWIGGDLRAGQRPQVIVPRDVWQGCRVRAGGIGWALLGCTVSPGFDWADFRIGGRDEIHSVYRGDEPAIRSLIDALTVPSTPEHA